MLPHLHPLPLRAALLLCLLLPFAASAQPTDPFSLSDATRNNAGIEYRNPRDGDLFYPVVIRGYWGQMNQSGYLVVPPLYDWTDFSYDGFARFVVDGRTGYLNLAGNVGIEPTFEYADRFAEGYAVVGTRPRDPGDPGEPGDPDAAEGGEPARYTYIDQAGEPITRETFDGAVRFREGFAGVMKDGRCGFLDKRGRVVIPLRYASVRSFREGLAAVRFLRPDGRPGGVGYIDKRGVAVFQDTAGELLDLGDFCDGYARVRTAAGWGFIDRGFRARIAPRFEDARDFHDGLAAARSDGRWGFINKAGDWVIRPTFDAADDFDETLALIAVDGRLGFTNRDLSFGIEPQFAAALPYFRDYARVTRDPSFGYIDVSGRPVWDPRRAEIAIVDTTFSSEARRRVLQSSTGIARPTPVLLPPEPRETPPEPYPPDYLYDEVLPQPEPIDADGN